MPEPAVLDELQSFFSERSKTRASISLKSIDKEVFNEKSDIYRRTATKLGVLIPNIVPKLRDFIPENSIFDCPDLNALDSGQENEIIVKQIPILLRWLDKGNASFDSSSVVGLWSMLIALSSIYSIAHNLETIPLCDLLKLDTLGLTLMDAVGPMVPEIDKICSETVRTGKSKKKVKAKKEKNWQHIIEEFHRLDQSERKSMRLHTMARKIETRLLKRLGAKDTLSISCLGHRSKKCCT